MYKLTRILSGGLAGASFLLFACFFSEIVVSAERTYTEVSVWDGTYDVSWYDAEETELHITNAAEFEGVRVLLDNDVTFEGVTLILDTDIDINYSDDWIPLREFYGNFQGNNHTIIGLPSYFMYKLYGSIENCNFIDCNIEITAEIQEGTTMRRAAVCIENYGTINNCVASGRINANNASLIGSSKYSYIYEEDYSNLYLGGICVENMGEISNCANLVYIDASAQKYSGHTRTLVGGICTISTGTITNSCNTASLVANGESSGFSNQLVGGICNKAWYTATIKNCYNRANLIGRDGSAGIMARANYDWQGDVEDRTKLSFSYNVGKTEYGIFGFEGLNPRYKNRYYLDSCSASVDETGDAKDKAYMQSASFVSALGNDFTYIEGQYPKLDWELEEPPLIIDLNSDYSFGVTDVIALQKHLLTLQTFTKRENVASDVNKDGLTNGFDLAVLKRMLLSE